MVLLTAFKNKQLGQDTSGANNTTLIAADNANANTGSHILFRVDAANSVWIDANGLGINGSGVGESYSTSLPDSPLHIKGQGTGSRSARFERTGSQYIDIIQSSSENKIQAAVYPLVLAGATADVTAVKIADRTPFRLPRFTTAQRGNITPETGMVIYNSTTNRVNAYQGSGWINLDDGTAA